MDIKICGLSDEAMLSVAIDAGATHVGLNFYPPSPRSITPGEARELGIVVPPEVAKVALVVDADDSLLEEIVHCLQPDLIQLHGSETPERTEAIRRAFATPVMKVIKVASNEDIVAAESFEGIADRIMFDAKAPKDMKEALPGGNGVAFDWSLLEGRAASSTWMLAGGLTVDNVGDAIRATGAPGVDTASGVEDSPGVKNAEKIRAFVAAAKSAFSE